MFHGHRKAINKFYKMSNDGKSLIMRDTVREMWVELGDICKQYLLKLSFHEVTWCLFSWMGMCRIIERMPSWVLVMTFRQNIQYLYFILIILLCKFSFSYNFINEFRGSEMLEINSNTLWVARSSYQTLIWILRLWFFVALLRI